MADDRNDDESVGYGRPPRKHQFKPGQSGNPKGRPRSSKNFATLFIEEFGAKVPINEGGKRRHIELRRLAIRQLARKAGAGDPRATQIMLEEMRRFAERAEAVPDTMISADDDLLIADILQRVRRDVDDNGGTQQCLHSH